MEKRGLTINLGKKPNMVCMGEGKVIF